jgi:hypothetical protein
MKKVKIFFYILFILDILASCVVAVAASVLAGVTTAIVLLSINITVYAIILKADKAGKRGAK